MRACSLLLFSRSKGDAHGARPRPFEKRWFGVGLIFAALSGLSACSPDSSKEKARIRDARMMPLGLGTLAVSPDGRYAVAAYAEREAVYVTDLEQDESALVEVGRSGLGRVEVSSKLAFVAEQQASEVVVIDLETKREVATFTVCSTPRGLAVSADEASLFVACASGQLWSVDIESGELVERFGLEPDLNDVQVLADGFAVSKFRSAEVLVLDHEGSITGRFRPPHSATLGQPVVAWRMIEQGGRIHLLHHYATEAALGGGVVTGRGYYGNGCTSQVVVPTVSVFEPTPSSGPSPGDEPSDAPFLLRSRVHFSGLAGALDMTVTSRGGVAVVAPGNAWAPRPRQALVVVDSIPQGDSTNRDGCNLLPVAIDDPGFDDGEPRGIAPGQDGEPDPLASDDAFVGVAAAPSGLILSQLAERTELMVGAGAPARRVPLGGGIATNVGHRYFHMSTDLAVACVSCHPGGSDDGHTWNFVAFGKRRTQTLRGGISPRTVFHWDGSIPDFDSLVQEVFGTRMGLTTLPNVHEQKKLVRFLDQLPSPERVTVEDSALVSEGARLFRSPEVDCIQCHSGPRLSDGKVYDVGTGGLFVTPSLLGIGTRAPYMHDGCAPDLRARFGACGGGDEHGRTTHLDDDQIEA